jgi:peptidyl-tRNA hydrolase, PTH2 family
MKVKQVIVMRKDLNMRKGKQISQGSHSSLKVILDMMDKEVIRDTKIDSESIIISPSSRRKLTLEYGKDSELGQWLEGLFTKVVVSCKDELELLDIYLKAQEAKLPVALITDVGLTEFKGVPTRTCLAIGPADEERINKITGHLPLL